MAGDLQDFIRQLVKLATFLLDATLNTLCGFLVLLALVLPWRCAAVLLGACAEAAPFQDQAGFRSWALGQFGCSLVDLVAVPLGLACALWPLRWPYLVDAWPKAYRSGVWNLQWSGDLRMVWLTCFCTSLGDALAVPFVVCAFAAPWRILTTVSWLRSWPPGRDFNTYVDDVCSLTGDFSLACEGASAIADLPFFAWSLPSLVSPSRWYAWTALSFQRRKRDARGHDCDIRCFWLWAPVLSLVDLAAAALALASLANPLCAAPFFRSFRAHWHDDPGEGNPADDLYYKWDLRKDCFKFGLLSVCDLASLPATGLVLITAYRSQEYKCALRSRLRSICPSSQPSSPCAVGLLDAAGQGGGTTRATAAQLPAMGQYFHVLWHQFGMLWLDLLTLPFLATVLLTWYRSRPVRLVLSSEVYLQYHATALRQFGVLLLDLATLPCLVLAAVARHRWPAVQAALWGEDPLVYHGTVARQAALVLLDVATLPCLLVVLVFHYRWPHVREAMATSSDAPLRYHATVGVQCLLVCLDVVTSPCLLLVVATWYRWGGVRGSLPGGRASMYLEYHRAVTWNTLVILHDTLLLASTLILALTIYRVPRARQILRDEEGDKRRRLWLQVLELLADLPFLPLLILLIVTCWRADLVVAEIRASRGDCERRRAIADQAVRLLRDLVGVSAVAVVAVTVVRCPVLALALWAQRSRPASGTPRFTPTSATLFMPARGGNEPATITVLAGQPEARRREELGRLSMNLVSAPLFDEATRVVGKPLVDFGRGFLPLKVTDGNWLRYDDVLPCDARIEFRFHATEEQRARVAGPLLWFDGDVPACAQLEHARPDGHREVLLRIPLPLRYLQQMVREPGQEVPLPEELLAPGAAEELCGELVQGVGFRESMWLCALSQLGFLVLDAIHVPLLGFVAMAPWRLPAYIRVLCAPESGWFAFVARRLLRMSALQDDAARAYRCDFEPVLNLSAKRHGTLLTERVDFSLGSKHIARGHSLVEEWMVRELSQAYPQLVQQHKAHSDLRDAVMAYWPSLVFAGNVEKMRGKIDSNEHAYLLCQLSSAQHRAGALLAASAEKLRESGAAARGEAGFQPFGKPEGVQRRLTRLFALQALADWGVAALALLLVVTVYRVPLIVRDTLREGDAAWRDRLRVAIVNHVQLLARDAWNLVTAASASVLALVTLLRALEFLEDVVRHCSCLDDVREAGLSRSREALGALCELFGLLLAWKTYKFLVRAAVFGLLMPSSGISWLHPWMRMALWSCLCALPWVLPGPALVLGVVLLVAAASLCMELMELPSARHDARCEGGQGVRLSLLNALAVAALAGDAAVLVAAPALRPWLLGRAALYAAIGTSVTWLLVVTTPLAVEGFEEEQVQCRSSAMYHAGVHALRRFAVLPAMAVLLVHMSAGGGPSHFVVLLLLFVSTTCILGHELQSVEHLPPSLGLDITPPPLYLGGLAFAQIALLACELLCPSAALRVCAAALFPLWALAYAWIVGPMDGPRWWPALQESATLVPLVFWAWAWARQATGGGCSVDLAAAAVLLVLGIVTARRWCSGFKAAQAIIREESARAGVPEAFRALQRRGALLCRAAEIEGLYAAIGSLAAHRCPISAAAAAAALEDFEAHVRIERLSAEFLRRRRKWVEALRAGRGSFERIVSLASDLLGAMQTPPTRLLVVMALRKACPAAGRVPAPLWGIIMQMVGGTHPLDKLLEPVVGRFAGGTPPQQLRSACALMTSCTRANARLCRTRASGAPIATELDQEVKLLGDHRRGGLCGELRTLGMEESLAATPPIQLL